MKRIIAIWIGWLLCATTVVAQGNGNDNALKDSIFRYYDLSEFDDVVRIGKQAVEMYEAQGDLYDLAGCYNLLGNAYQRMGLFKEAIESYERCAEAMEQMKANETEGGNAVVGSMYDRNIRYTRNNMAEVFLAIGELGQAEKLYHECVEMLGEAKDTVDFQDLATYQQNLAEVALRQAEASKDEAERNALLSNAVGMAEQAVGYSRRYDNLPFKKTSKLVSLAHAYQAAGMIDEAVAAATEAQASEGAENTPFLLTEIHILNGDLEASMGRYEDAKSHYDKALAIAKENHFDVLLMTTLKGAYDATKHFDKGLALDYLEELANLRDTLLRNEQQQIIRDYQVKYDLSEKEHQLAIETAKNHSNKQIIILLAVLTLLLLGLFFLMTRMSVIRKRQKEILERIVDAKDNVFSIVSHDFKTSVSSQNLLLGVMNDHIDEMSRDDIKEKVQTLKNSSDLLREHMFSIIEWVKLELNGGGNLCKPFMLRNIVDEAVGLHKVEITKKNIDIANQVGADLGVNDNADLVKLVLRNLVSNAVKFSWPGGTVEIDAKEEGRQVWLTVADHGVGMSDDRLKSLTHSAISPKAGTHGNVGSGIGLMVCRRLLERNGGQMEVESTEGTGTTVRFSMKKA